MKCYHRLLTTLSLFLCYLAVYGQVSFSNGNYKLPTASFRSGVAIAVSDVNGDGLDDLVRLGQARQLTIDWQSFDGGSFNSQVFSLGGGQAQWSICTADVDNNGIGDVLYGGSYDGVKLWKGNASGTSYTSSQLPGPGLFVQGTNLVDINNDGWLDFFSCHDDGESRIWANDGQGNFVAADDWIDMATIPASDNSGNYGSVWTDIDNDGDMDLYIAKCRQGVNDPQDPRRINALYINDGSGQFSERAAEANLKIGAQSWTADFGDIDNDGDMDCFITNHDVPSQLLINDGQGVFTDITATAGIVVQGLPIQGIMRDFNNDGFVDILVSGTRHYLYINNGDLTFSSVTGLFNNNQVESFAVGDLNHDGYLDIYAGYAQIYTTPSNIDDVLWLNNGGDNHFLNVSLQGVTSNRSGVGARLELYGPWGVQIREVRAGESYGITNSLHQHFGLGQHLMADSLVIRWPSGTVDIYTDLEADQFINVIENTCISPPSNLSLSGPTTMCTGDSLEISAPQGYTYQWNTGQSTASISVATQGSYQVSVTNGTGCASVSQVVQVVVDPDETPTIQITGDTIFCSGGSVLLTASPAVAYLWSDGSTAQSVEISSSGTYTVTIPGQCRDFSALPVVIDVISIPQPNLEDIQLSAADSVTLTAEGQNIRWYEDAEGSILLGSGNQLTIPWSVPTFDIYADARVIFDGGSAQVGQTNHTGSNFSGNQFNGGIIFDAYQPFTLNTVKVYTDREGYRIIELRDALNVLIDSQSVFVPVGTHVLTLNMPIPQGSNLVLTTNQAHNTAVFGYVSPRLRRSDSNVTFPYNIENIVSLKSTTLGADRYYYFYDWTIDLPDEECVSERATFTVTILADNDLGPTGELSIYPNPTTGIIHLMSSGQVPAAAECTVISAAGQVLEHVRPSANGEVDISTYPPGIYWLRTVLHDQRKWHKIIKL